MNWAYLQHGSLGLEVLASGISRNWLLPWLIWLSSFCLKAGRNSPPGSIGWGGRPFSSLGTHPKAVPEYYRPKFY